MKPSAVFLAGLLCFGTGRAEEWQKLVREPFVVWVHAEDVQNAHRVLTMSEESLLEIRSFLEEVHEAPVTIVIASSEAEFMALTDGQVPEWGTAAADPVHGTVILKSPRLSSPDVKLRRVIAHELAHVSLSRAAGGRPVERWFDEGFAQVISVEPGFGDILHLARSLASGQLIPLAAVNDVLTFQRSRATLAYRQSRAAVSYLIETYGWESIAGIARRLRSGDMDAALRAEIGIGGARFEREWVAAMKKAYRWYVFLDFPVVLSAGMVFLFFAALILTRRRTRKRRELWEEQATDGMEQAKDPASD